MVIDFGNLQMSLTKFNRTVILRFDTDYSRFKVTFYNTERKYFTSSYSAFPSSLEEGSG